MALRNTNFLVNTLLNVNLGLASTPDGVLSKYLSRSVKGTYYRGKVRYIVSSSSSYLAVNAKIRYFRLFFKNRPPKKQNLKLKTQAKNSRKKLNLREAVSSLQEKLKEKAQGFDKFRNASCRKQVEFVNLH